MTDRLVEAPQLGRWAVVGDGQVGRALVGVLPWLNGPFGRGFTGQGFDIVLLAVPDHEISQASAAIERGPIVGHCAGSRGLDVLAPHEAFGLHPLMTVTRQGAQFAGAGAAIAGSTARALHVAASLAEALEMRVVEIADEDRALYHAAASIASNFLVTLEHAAEVLFGMVGADRSLLVPLARASLENWALMGVPAALTGPIARGDEATVARQRSAVADRAPELLDLFDALSSRTRAIAGREPFRDR